jgi:dipeptidyl aminopeptidase/acylaminoacyl peptidase
MATPGVSKARAAGLVAIATLSFVTPGSAQPPPSPAPLSVTDALSVADLQDATFSADGKHVAYTVCRPPDSDAPTSSYRLASGVPMRLQGCRVEFVSTTGGTTVAVPTGNSVGFMPAWSPDGRTLAFYSDLDGELRVWVFDVATGQRRRVSDVVVRPEHKRSGGLQWLPDGNRLLAKALPEGITRQALEARVDAASGFDTRSDKKPIVFTFDGVPSSASPPSALPPSATSPSAAPMHSPRPGAPDLTVVDASNRAIAYTGDLVELNVSSGAVRRLSNGGQIHRYLLSPDGRHVGYHDFLGTIPGHAWSWIFESSVIRIEDGKVIKRVRHTGDEYFRVFSSWSPGGQLFTFANCRFLDLTGHEIDLDGRGEIRNCGTYWQRDQNRELIVALQRDPAARANSIWTIDPSAGTSRRVGAVPGLRAQLLNDRNATRAWALPDSRIVVIAMDEDTKALTFSAVRLTDGHVQTQRTADQYAGDSPEEGVRDISRDGRWLVYTNQSGSEPEELWLADAMTGEHRPLTYVNGHLAKYVFGRTRLISWRNAFDGRTMRGAVILPTNYTPGKRYPLLAWVYSQDLLSQQRNVFGGTGNLRVNLQLFATRDYVVFLPDCVVRPGQPLRSIGDSILPGIDKMVEMGFADPQRMAVAGHSYGGYTVLSLLVTTGRFKAAMASGGLYDWTRAYGALTPTGTTPNFDLAEPSLGGTPWDARERYIENSPFFFLDRVTTPLLLQHGTLDPVDVRQAEAVFAGLRRLGKRVTLVEYPDDYHSLDRRRHQIEYLQHFLDWCTRHLDGQPSEVPTSSLRR